METGRKKLIEVSLPLDVINRASAREKSIRHGHPSTLHLWWARRPLAACRAVLFAQLVDDPSAWPEEFPTEEDQKRERARLHGVIAEMVPWEATNDERILNKARYEIARSLARGRGEAAPPPRDADAVLGYLREHAPPVCDPFCGGGSIPLEAQRLGLRAFGSDLNPVAVLVSKATCEIPPKFAGWPPVNPERDLHVVWKGAQGLAADIRYYGKWMRDEAEKRIGHLYPKVEVPEEIARDRSDLRPYVGRRLTVIAWLWARTVVSPDPMVRGAHVPLVSTFILSSKKGREVIAVPIVDGDGGYRFSVRSGGIGADELANAKSGTKAARGANFTCVVSGTPIPGDHIKAEGMAGRMGTRLMAVVAEGHRSRVYLPPMEEMEAVARSAEPMWAPEESLPDDPRNFWTVSYGLNSFADLFTDRQLVALTTFSDLVSEARERVQRDYATALGTHAGDGVQLSEGGTGAQAYADAVATYLAFALDKMADRGSSLCTWFTERDSTRNTLSRQALPMTWDFAELNPLLTGTGSFLGAASWTAESVEGSFSSPAQVSVFQQNAANDTRLVDDAVIATDPPYYDNIGYADLSDFFYVWLRRTLRNVWPDLFRRMLAPKDEELVATPYRHGGRAAAERFFMEGMGRALVNMHAAGRDDFPVTIYYAFKQSEIAKEGLTSPGWATFLQGVVDAGYVIDGTWPVRTELSNRTIGIGANVLASSIVLVCRKRPSDAPVITRREFVARLRSVLPSALEKIRAGGVRPVDMAQASIGPGMGVFTGCSKVLEPDDSTMTVRTAIALINQVRDEISGEETGGYDADTRFCIDWFEAFGMESGKAGDAITMAQAYDIGLDGLAGAGVFSASGGSARLLRRDELPAGWRPETDVRLTHWECAQHLARVVDAPDGGIGAAALLLAGMGTDDAGAARGLAYRLYDICERKGRAEEAQVWNMLAREWPAIEAEALRFEQEEREKFPELDLQGGE